MIRTQDASVNRKDIQKTKPTNEIVKADKVTPSHRQSGPTDASPKTENGAHEKRHAENWRNPGGIHCCAIVCSFPGQCAIFSGRGKLKAGMMP